MTVKEFIEDLKRVALTDDGWFINPVKIVGDGVAAQPDDIDEDFLDKEIDSVVLQNVNANVKTTLTDEIVYTVYVKE